MLSALSAKVQRGLLEFAWRQWAQMGLSANLAGSDRWAIDPEALIAFTIEVARRDPRLFDELLDWLAFNRQLVSVTRLRNLALRLPGDPGLVAAALAWAGEQVSSVQWPRRQLAHGRTFDGDRVFSTDVLNFVPKPDHTFAGYGYMRPRARRSGKSSAPNIGSPVNFAFQLRGLFGSGSRSEVMRVLITYPDGPLDAARISDEAGFAKRNVSETLAGLVDSRAVTARWSGNERLYSTHRSNWARLLEVGPSGSYLPDFVSWVHLLPASLEIMFWLDAEAYSTESDYLVSSRARDLVERVGTDLTMANISLPPTGLLAGAAFLPAFVNIVDSVLAKLGIAEETSTKRPPVRAN